MTAIGDHAFSASGGGKSRLKVSSIIIPESVAEIGAEAFYDRYGLKSLTVPPSVTVIGEDAFKGCPDLILTVYEGSVAEQYAIDNNIPYTYAD